MTQEANGIADVVVNGGDDPYGYGWSVAGVDKLLADSHGVLWVYGTGGSQSFSGNGDGSYNNPPGIFGALVKNADGSFTYTDTHQTLWRFSAAGLLTSIVDPHNLQWQYTYNANNGLNQVTAPDGGVTTFGYDGNGKLQSIAEPGGPLHFTVTNGELKAITDVDTTTRGLDYDANHRLTHDQWDPYNVNFAYTASTGEIATLNQGLGGIYQIFPVTAGNTTASNANGSIGVPASITDPRSLTTS